MNIKKLPRHTNKVTVRFTDEMYAKLSKLAKKNKISISEVIRHAATKLVFPAYLVEKDGKVTRLNDFDPELKAQGLEE